MTVQEERISSVAAGPGVRRRVLFVSYAFPPVGGAGVQRTTKFIKYLSQEGWDASVLTVENPSVPVRDESLLKDVPASVRVVRARTLEPGYAIKNTVADGGAAKRGGFKAAWRGMARSLVKMALQPDPQVLWTSAAVRAGKKLLQEVPHDVVVVSGPPFSSFRIGMKLSKWAKIPLVLDYRDEWDISNAYLENKRLDPVSLRLQRWMQRRAVRQASAVIATTQHSAAALEKVCREARATAQANCIYNGYDPADFQSSAQRPAGRERYQIAYVGTLWNLTDVSPIVAAAEKLCEHEPALATKLELVFVGRRTPAQQEILNRLRGKACTLVEHPYLPHSEALALVRDADALCVLLSDVPGAGRVVPAKIFEYMAARKTILCAAPKGELWDLLEGYPAARVHEPADVEGIAAAMAADVRGARPADFGEFDPSRFSRPAQTRQLAQLLAGLVRESGR